MSESDVVAALNELLALEHRSLPQYLATAAPWVPAEQREALVVLKRIAKSQAALCQRIAQAIFLRSGSPEPGDYPVEYAGWHYLALDYLADPILAYGERVILRINDLLPRLDSDAEARALTEEVLGMEKGHYDQLREAFTALKRTPQVK